MTEKQAQAEYNPIKAIKEDGIGKPFDGKLDPDEILAARRAFAKSIETNRIESSSSAHFSELMNGKRSISDAALLYKRYLADHADTGTFAKTFSGTNTPSDVNSRPLDEGDKAVAATIEQAKIVQVRLDSIKNYSDASPDFDKKAPVIPSTGPAAERGAETPGR